MRVVVLAVLASCAPHKLPADTPVDSPHDALRQYTIWLGGARVGTATERELWAKDGVQLTRDEHLRFLRGDAEIALATTIVIDADMKLIAHRVRWTEQTSDDVRAAEALHADDGWHMSTGNVLAGSAVPAELVPLLVRRDGSFAGTVFLPARGFVAGAGRIDPVAPGRLVARLALAAGPVVEATIDLDRDGSPARVVDGEGVIALRATDAQASAPFAAVDLIAATAIPIDGERHGRRLVLDGTTIELDSALPGPLPPGPAHRDRTPEIRTLVAAVQSRIRPSLGKAASTRDAATATAGDCTTFALAYAALATRRSIPTRVVTGLRVDGARLVRHRWAASWTGTRWIAIDAAFGAVPAGPDLIGLAVHDADDAGLVAGEAALAHVRSAAWAE